MQSITYQPFLRPALPQVFGPKEYREERQLFIRIDELLSTSGLEAEFIGLSMKHCGFDPGATGPGVSRLSTAAASSRCAATSPATSRAWTTETSVSA